MSNLHNRPFLTTETEQLKTVPFHTLTHGKFKYTPNGNVSTVLKRDEDSITLRRSDGWLVTVRNGEEGWGKEIIICR